MSKKSKRPKLDLREEEVELLKSNSRSRTLPKQVVQRSKILLDYHGGMTITEIHRTYGITRTTVYKCIDKALQGGIEAGLADKVHAPRMSIITDEAKLWVVNLACTKPKDHGYAAEFWTYSSMAKHTREYAIKDGHESLAKAAKATIFRILKSNHIRPQEIKYYLEKRDPDFDEKMKEVLMVYQEVTMQNQQEEEPDIITISVDEKPGVQAIENVATDLPPKVGKSRGWSRDYEYKRHGTLSILAALDLHDGHVIAQVHGRHRSREFIELLKEVDSYYAEDTKIRVILDNHSSHISKETMAYLASRSNRFIFVHTPTHGSWLNIVETLFGKMARTFLKGIRVKSIFELKERIMLGVQEINDNPVVHRWRKFEYIK